MRTAFVLGNGQSRRNVCLEQLKNHGRVYGCNALHRDFVPDVLVATDRPIATAIQESGYALQHEFYTRRPLSGLGAKPVPKDYFGFSSGPIAMGLAAKDHAGMVYLIGFDMGPTTENRLNNLYAGTEFYRGIDAPPTFTGNWVKQMLRIASDFKHVQFVRVMGDLSAQIKEFDACANLSCVDMSTFADRINNKKDL